MRYGFYLPTRGPTATRDSILTLAREGERLGLHSAMIADRIAGDIRSFAAIGMHELVFDCRGQSIAESIERLQWFATDVIPLADG
jgi:hypothetical protein